MFDDMPNAEQRARSVKEQMKLHDELWGAIERNVALWENDETMSDKMIAAILMTAATTFSGDMLGMVANAMGMRRAALEHGADLIRNGALAAATIALKELEDEKSDSRH
jgi:hypothetical protein